MGTEHTRSKTVIPEILDETGRIVADTETLDTSEMLHEGAYVKAGLLTGFFALAFSFVMILLGALVTVFIIVPLVLVGRLLGVLFTSARR